MYRVVVLLALACGPGTALGQGPTYTEGASPNPRPTGGSPSTGSM